MPRSRPDLVGLLRHTFLVATITLGALAVTVAALFFVQRRADAWRTHSREVVLLAERARSLAVDRETGVRGFLLTGDTASLEPERVARPALAAALDSLAALTADNADQQAHVRAAQAAVARWDRDYARPALDGAAGAGGPVAGERALAGKPLFDAVRARLGAVQEAERVLLDRRVSRERWLRAAEAVLLITEILLIAIMLRRFRRQLVGQAEENMRQQAQLEEQAVELEAQSAQLQEQTTELEVQSEELFEHNEELAQVNARLSAEAAQREAAEHEVRALNAQLQARLDEVTQLNAELESFSYSVSHDLRTPLNALSGFSSILLEDHESQLDAEGRGLLERIRVNARRMAGLIEGLLTLSRASRTELRAEPVDLSALARRAAEELRRAEPDRQVAVTVADGLATCADPRLMGAVMQNLVGNAWKFTRRAAAAAIVVERAPDGTNGASDGAPVFVVRDNGAGFNPAYAAKLFEPFQRLHTDAEFEGTGVGLATVQRIVQRHGGRIWADGAEGAGAAFYFTLSVDG